MDDELFTNNQFTEDEIYLGDGEAGFMALKREGWDEFVKITNEHQGAWPFIFKETYLSLILAETLFNLEDQGLIEQTQGPRMTGEFLQHARKSFNLLREKMVNLQGEDIVKAYEDEVKEYFTSNKDFLQEEAKDKYQNTEEGDEDG